MQRLCNSILLVGISQVCGYKLDSQLKEAVETEGRMPVWIKGLVESVMKPLSCCKGQNWSSCRLDEQVKSSPPKAKVKNVAPLLVEEGRYFVVNFSPNVLSLFLETRVDLALRKVYLMSPRVNNRHLHIDRVWNGEAIKKGKDPGIIDTMLDLAVGKKNGDKSLSESYLFFPYAILERSAVLDSQPGLELVFSEHVFSCQKRLDDESHICGHPRMNIYRHLLELLEQEVCKDCFYCVNRLMLLLRIFCFFLSFTTCFRMRRLLVLRRVIPFLSCFTK